MTSFSRPPTSKRTRMKALVSIFCMNFVLFLSFLTASAFANPRGGRRHDPSVKVSAAGFCLFSNEACEMEEDNLITQYEQTSNPVGCAERCVQSNSCEKWTWWNGKNTHGKDNLCQLFTNCSTTPNCTNCYTGPRSCGLWINPLAAVSGGINNDGIVGDVMLVGDDVCQTKLELPHPRWGHVSTAIGKDFFVCGGTFDQNLTKVPTSTSTCDNYDTNSQTWTVGAELRVARTFAAGVESFGEFYVMGGYTENGTTGQVEMYNPNTKAWKRGMDLPEPLQGHCAVAVKDVILVIGGKGVDEMDNEKMYMFNVTTRMWTVLPKSMRTPRSFHGCSNYHRRLPDHHSPEREVVVTGGLQGNKPVDTVEAFSLTTKTWRILNPLPFPLAGHGQVNLEVPRTYGGNMAGSLTSEVLQMVFGEKWANMLNRTTVEARMYPSVTPFPGDLIHC